VFLLLASLLARRQVLGEAPASGATGGTEQRQPNRSRATTVQAHSGSSNNPRQLAAPKPHPRSGFIRFLSPENLESHEVICRVQDESGAPVPGARVRAVCLPSNENPSTSESLTDASALVRFADVEASSCILTAEAEGYARVYQGEHHLTFPRIEGDVYTITLHPPQVFAAKVLDAATSTPIEGARVAVTNQWENEKTALFGGDNSSDDILTATTTADGTFQLEGLRPGFLNLEVRHPGYAMVMPAKLPVDTTTGVIALDHGGTLRGTVLGNDAPLAGVGIRLGGLRCNRRIVDDALTTTAEDGTFEIRNISMVCGYETRGTVKSFSIAGTSLPFPKYEFLLSPDKLEREFVLHPSDYDRATTAGEKRVLRLDGVSFIDVFLDTRTTGTAVLTGTLELLNPQDAQHRKVQLISTSGGMFGTQPDEHGRFVFEKLSAGKYTLSCRSERIEIGADSYIPHLHLELAEGEQRAVVLRQPYGAIEGTVTGAKAGIKYRLGVQPHDKTAREANQNLQQISGCELGPGGTFLFTGLHPGRYRVQVSGESPKKSQDNKSMFVGGSSVLAEAEVSCDGRTTATVQLAAAGRVVTGKVVDADTGDPIPNIYVNATSTSAQQTDISDEKGQFRIEPVSEGPLRLVINQYRWLPMNLNSYGIKIIDKNVSGIELDLGEVELKKSRGGILVRTSPRPEEMQSIRARIWKAGEDPSDPSIFVDLLGATKLAADTHLIRPLLPGTYNLDLEWTREREKPQCRVVLRDVVVGTDAITEVQMPEAPGEKVSLNVESDSALSELEGGVLWLSGPDDTIRPISSAGPNMLETHLCPGNYTVGVTLLNGHRQSTQFTVHPAGANQQVKFSITGQ